MTEYIKQPSTAVIEGLSSALAEINTARDVNDLPDLNLTDAEIAIIQKEITDYILHRFHMTPKD